MMLSWSMLVPSRKCSRMVKILAMAQLYFRRFVTVLITLFRALMYVLLIGKTSSGFWISWDTLLWCMYCSFGRQVLASEYLETFYFDVCIAHSEDKFWLLNILRHFTLKSWFAYTLNFMWTDANWLNCSINALKQSIIFVCIWNYTKSYVMITFKLFLTHCGRVTQICVFMLQLCRTGDANLRF